MNEKSGSRTFIDDLDHHPHQDPTWLISALSIMVCFWVCVSIHPAWPSQAKSIPEAPKEEIQEAYSHRPMA